MASGPLSPYKTNWNKYEDAMDDVVHKEVCRVFLWLYQGGSKYVGDYLYEIKGGMKGLSKDEKNMLICKEPPTEMDITFLYLLLQRTCGLPKADDPIWTNPTGSDCSSLEHTLYLIKKERNTVSHERQKREAQRMSSDVLYQKLDYLHHLCANLLVEAAQRCGRLDEEIVELTDKMETKLQKIRGVTSDKFIQMAKKELKTARIKVADEWYQQPLLRRQGHPVTLDDLLQWRAPDGAAPTSLLVTGEAGVGKSSLCRCRMQIEVETPERRAHKIHQEETRESEQAAKSIKQFYLWDVMQFILPFLKSRIQTGTLPPFSPGDDNEDPADVEDDSVDHEGDIVCETSKEGPEIPRITENDPSPPSFATSSRRGRKRAADDLFERTVADFISKKSGDESGNPDLQFFKSILPDVAGFSASQKRRFKIKVIKLIDDIANEGSASRSSSVVSAYSGSTDNSYQQHPEAHDVMGEPAMRMDPRDPDSYSRFTLL